MLTLLLRPKVWHAQTTWPASLTKGLTNVAQTLLTSRQKWFYSSPWEEIRVQENQNCSCTHHVANDGQKETDIRKKRRSRFIPPLMSASLERLAKKKKNDTYYNQTNRRNTEQSVSQGWLGLWAFSRAWHQFVFACAGLVKVELVYCVCVCFDWPDMLSSFCFYKDIAKPLYLDKFNRIHQKMKQTSCISCMLCRVGRKLCQGRRKNLELYTRRT